MEVEIEQLTPNLSTTTALIRKMNELKESIRAHGIIQPIIVRESAQGYEIVAGERRLRAP